MHLDATAVLDEKDLQTPDPQDEIDAAGETEAVDNSQADPQERPETEEANSEASESAKNNPVRSVTIATPDELETLVQLMIRTDGDEQAPWVPGYKVARDYESDDEHFVSHTVEYLDTGCKTLGEAVLVACDRANYFICTNSADDDPKAAKVGEILDNWYESASGIKDDITETIFDKEVAAEDSQAETETQHDNPDDERNQTPENQTLPPVPETKFVITDEAQQHFDKEKRRLEERNMELFRAEGTLSQQLKTVREALKDNREDYNDLLDRGPERLSLFDQPQIASATDETASTAEEDATEPVEQTKGEAVAETPATKTTDTPAEQTEPATSPPQPANESDEAWRKKPIAEIDGLTDKIIEILEGLDIRTVGDWVDVPLKRGCEYTQLKGVTEKRLEKIQAAMLQVTT